MGRLSSFIDKIKPLKERSVEVKEIEGLISKDRVKIVKDLIDKGLVKIETVEMKSQFVEDVKYPKIVALHDKVDTVDVNRDIKVSLLKDLFDEFSKKAYDVLPTFIAPDIAGMDEAKKAIAIQLFSKQPVHILLLGDPGTGKTDLLRASFTLSPVSSFGLGSGTSGAGLVVTVKGNKIMKGLLPLADKGVCCIDELNLMKDDSRAGLYNAMEKGFVTYDKGGHHYKFDSRVRVLATANPKGDKFKGKTIEKLRDEMPFDSALLTRFHIVFFIRKPDLERFKEIASSIASGKKTEVSQDDVEFIKAYIDYQRKKDVDDIDKDLQEKIVDFISGIKKDENDYLVEVSPRMIIGFMRMCKSLALMRGRTKVELSDIDEIKGIVKESLKITLEGK